MDGVAWTAQSPSLISACQEEFWLCSPHSPSSIIFLSLILCTVSLSFLNRKLSQTCNQDVYLESCLTKLLFDRIYRNLFSSLGISKISN
jgi:hypothetical protein